MTTIHPLSLQATLVPPIEERSLKETAPRRQLKAELADIKKMLAESKLNDALTKNLRVWCTCFCYYLGLEETADRAIKEYIPILREMLIDPLTLKPLGDEPLLGSDGRTYSKMSLTMYYSGVPEQYRKRSPKDPNNETPFTWEVHPVAKRLIKWLTDQGEYKPSQQEVRQYRELATSSKAPNIPSAANATAERIQRLRAIQAERAREERKDDGRERIAAAEREAERMVTAAYAPVHARIEQVADQNMQRVQANQARTQESFVAIEREIERLNREVENLRKGNEELNAQINRTQATLSQSVKNTHQLERDINDAKRELAERKSEWLKDLCTVALVVGGSFFAGWAIGQALASLGATGTTVGVKASEGAIRAGFNVVI